MLFRKSRAKLSDEEKVAVDSAKKLLDAHIDHMRSIHDVVGIGVSKLSPAARDALIAHYKKAGWRVELTHDPLFGDQIDLRGY